MLFRLIHYTTGWDLGAEVDLGCAPEAGALVYASDDNPDSYSDIFYVDNVMYGDGGQNYLFVRPFEGYGESAPLTEGDRTRAAIDNLRKDTERQIELLKNDIADLNSAVGELTQAVDNFADNVMAELKGDI